jgi:hypothetical protein
VDALSVEVSHNSKRTYATIQDPTGRERGFVIELNPISGKSIETIPTPEGGVWGIFLNDTTGEWEYFKGQSEFATNQLDDAPPPAKVRLRISVARVSIESGAGDAPLKANEERSLRVNNALAGLEQGRLVGMVSEVRKIQGEMARGDRKVFEVNVPKGAGLLVADVRPLGTEQVDADLYLYDCSGEECFLQRTSRSYRPEERVFVQNPKPGHWKVILDAGAAQAGHMRYEYRDFYAVPDAGMIGVLDAPLDRAPGTRWQATIKSWLTRAIGEGRSPAAVLYVQDAIRSSQFGAETITEFYGCETYPFCGSERREMVPLGLKLIALEDVAGSTQ